MEATKDLYFSDATIEEIKEWDHEKISFLGFLLLMMIGSGNKEDSHQAAEDFRKIQPIFMQRHKENPDFKPVWGSQFGAVDRGLLKELREYQPQN